MRHLRSPRAPGGACCAGAACCASAARVPQSRPMTLTIVTDSCCGALTGETPASVRERSCQGRSARRPRAARASPVGLVGLFFNQSRPELHVDALLDRGALVVAQVHAACEFDEVAVEGLAG